MASDLGLHCFQCPFYWTLGLDGLNYSVLFLLMIYKTISNTYYCYYAYYFSHFCCCIFCLMFNVYMNVECLYGLMLPLGANSFRLEMTPFQKGGKKVWQLPPLKVSILLKLSSVKSDFFFNLVLVSGVLCVCVCVLFLQICTQMYLLKYFFMDFVLHFHTHTLTHTHTHNDYVTQLPQCVKFNTPFNWNNDR